MTDEHYSDEWHDEESFVDEYDDEYLDDDVPESRLRFWHVVVLFIVLIIAAALLVYVILPGVQAFLFPPDPIPPLQPPIRT